jgi:hypothetical protein
VIGAFDARYQMDIIKERMGVLLRLISKIERTTPWRLVNHEIYGWAFKTPTGDYFDGSAFGPVIAKPPV